MMKRAYWTPEEMRLMLPREISGDGGGKGCLTAKTSHSKHVDDVIGHDVSCIVC